MRCQEQESSATIRRTDWRVRNGNRTQMAEKYRSPDEPDLHPPTAGLTCCLLYYSFGGVEHCLFGFRLARKAGVSFPSFLRSVSHMTNRPTAIRPLRAVRLGFVYSQISFPCTLLSGLCLMCWHILPSILGKRRRICMQRHRERLFDWTCLINASGEISKSDRAR